MRLKTWKPALALGLCAVGVLVFVVFLLPSGQAGEPQNADYVDPATMDIPNCGCHENWDGWALTKHAWAYDGLMNSTLDAPNRQYCEPCHNTGAGVPPIYPSDGYDPATNGPTYLRNVTCQACHGPAGNHDASPGKSTIALVLNSTLCGSCHYSTQGLDGHHPTFNEWAISGHNTSQTLPGYVKQPSCSNCHEALNAMQYLQNNGAVEKTVIRAGGEDAPVTWEIACMTCHDPHSTGLASPQLRLPLDKICATCHNSQGAVPGEVPHHPMAEMRNNTAGAGISRTGLDYMPDVYCPDCHMGNNLDGIPNHTFRPNPSACRVCHASLFPTNASAQLYIDSVATMTTVGINGVTPLVEEAGDLIERMRGNRTSQDLSHWTSEYEIAKFNLESVDSDSSEGNHNPGLASALLNDAQTRASQAVAKLTPPDKITDIRATRQDNGTVLVQWDKSGAADFAKYRIYVLAVHKTNITSDTATVEITSASTESYYLTGISNATIAYVYVTAVDTDNNEITNTVSAATVSGDLEGLLENLQDQVTELEDEIDDLKNDKTQLQQDVTDLEGQVSDLENERTLWAVLTLMVGIFVGVLIGVLIGRIKPVKPESEAPPAEKEA